MLAHQCPGCGAFIPYGKVRCDACQAKRDARDRERECRDGRGGAMGAPRGKGKGREHRPTDPKYKAFYKSADWRRLSAWALAQSGWRCADCGGVATDVHHVVPIQTDEGWQRRLDPDNVVALCVSCHNQRHGRFVRSKNRRDERQPRWPLT